MSRSLIRSTSLVGGFTLVSRVLGLLRDMAFAAFLAVGPAMDAFFVAFKIPNFMRRMFGEGAFSQAFVPVVSEYRQTRPHEEVKALVERVAGTFGALLLLINVIGLLAAPLLVMLFAPGFLNNPGQVELTTELLRVTFPYLFFIALTAFAGGVLNTYGRFGAPALAPVLLNIALISAAAWGSRWFETSVMALAWAVFAAGIAQLLLQLPSMAKLGLFPWPRFDRRHPGVRKVFRLMLPALFGSSVAQINLLVDTLIASFLAAGSVSWLYYADRLMEFPLGVFSIALATVILPQLSRDHAANDPARFSANLDFALRLLLLIALPAAVGLFVLSGPILATLFFHGAFRVEDVVMSQLALMAYSLGLIGFSLVKILAPGYFARQDTRTPVRVGLIAMGANVVLNLVIVGVMLWQDFQAPHAGLALATGLAALLNASMLLTGLRKTGVFLARPGWGVFLLRLLLACVLMAAAVTWLAGPLQQWLAWSATERVARLAAMVALGIAVFAVTLLASGFRPRQLR
ncbi:MAG TPA: murein biosynthesis integral membrane protein MurJ [Gammaproteobacteria bacterium]|nr:murein biosynthesis integral membrane protein MurJ [Gammaproteobacteria bacterium]